jgi:predicted nucleic acid-binding protein
MLPDAALGCQILHSDDLNAGRQYEDVEVRNPFPA